MWERRGGKGALITEEYSATLQSNSSQTLFVDEVYGCGNGQLHQDAERESWHTKHDARPTNRCYQEVTGTLMANSHPGSYCGQDAYNDMFIVEEL